MTAKTSPNIVIRPKFKIISSPGREGLHGTKLKPNRQLKPVINHFIGSPVAWFLSRDAAKPFEPDNLTKTRPESAPEHESDRTVPRRGCEQLSGEIFNIGDVLAYMALGFVEQILALSKIHCIETQGSSDRFNS